MAVKIRHESSTRTTFLLDKERRHFTQFSMLHPLLISSLSELQHSVGLAKPNSLWISYEKDLTEALLRSTFGPPRTLGTAVLIHKVNLRILRTVAGCFRRFIDASEGSFLPAAELGEVLNATNSSDLFIGGCADKISQTMTLYRGNLEPLTVPYSAFEKSGDGTEPDFRRFSITDYGQTVKLGDYEAAVDTVLYEFDPVYRRRIAKVRQQSEQSFGAALRRLRKQRGLRREDFEPEIVAKTIARIEQGKIQRIQSNTLRAIANRLHVKPEEIKTY
jgi:DNA-binding Xre family transcriptional regulator